MESFSGKIAVLTGGGTGIGRALALKLASEGCSVAMCDLSEANMAETARLAMAGAPQGVRISTTVADVSIEDQLIAFRERVTAEHDTDRIHFLFNNAGVGGGGSMIADSRAQWERVFNICWGGVYLGVRTFLPLLMKADEGHIINVSSVNGFFASIGPDRPHTAYSAAKFAVKGFTEALIADLRVNAPHVKAHVVMPGHIGTSIVFNSMAVLGATPGTTPPANFDPSEALARAELFRANGLPPERAAEIILDGVRDGRWRILVGHDAEIIDAAVRASPEHAYDVDFAGFAAAFGQSLP